MNENIELEVLPCFDDKFIKDLTLLLLKKGVISCEELNNCQNSNCQNDIKYLNAREVVND